MFEDTGLVCAPSVLVNFKALDSFVVVMKGAAGLVHASFRSIYKFTKDRCGIIGTRSRPGICPRDTLLESFPRFGVVFLDQNYVSLVTKIRMSVQTFMI
jgi:hypothetical protein